MSAVLFFGKDKNNSKKKGEHLSPPHPHMKKHDLQNHQMLSMIKSAVYLKPGLPTSGIVIPFI